MREVKIINNGSIYQLLFMVVQASLVLVIATVSLRLYSYNLKIPLGYGGDSPVVLMYIKGLLQDGWPTVISHLSAPFSYPGAAFPLLTSVDWSLMKFLSLFTDEPGLIMNLFWLSTLVFSSWSASYASYQLGLSRVFAATGGVLYAFLPYALLRFEHLNLVYYLVPLICLLAFVVASKGRYIRRPKQATVIGLLGCLFQGFNYIYYSFFAVILLSIAATISFSKAAGYRQFILPVLAVVVVTASTALNLIPAFNSRTTYGEPPEMGYKTPLESEIYGAKIRRMIQPHQDNVIHPLAQYAQKDIAASFPNENENVTVRLGLYGTIGMLLMFLFSLRQLVGVGEANGLSILSALSIAIILIITVGGFGAVINVLTVPDIRAYNRFSVFLSFFSICAASMWLQKITLEADSFRRRILRGIFFGLAAFSLYDQLLDRKSMLSQRDENIARAAEERMMVERLEDQLPSGTAVLQLPFTGYPLNLSFNKMNYYDHVRPFIWSKELRWSWPSFSLRHRAWQTKMAGKQGDDLIRAAVLSGFQAIWVDRFAYADNGEQLIKSLAQGNVTSVDIASNRFVVLDLREAEADLRARMPKDDFERLAAGLLGPEVVVEWGKGFYDEEKNSDGKSFRWSQDRSSVALRNLGQESVSACVSFLLVFPHPGHVEVMGTGSSLRLAASAEGQYVKFPVNLTAGDVRKLEFKADLPRLDALKDSRQLYFNLMDFDVDISSATAECKN